MSGLVATLCGFVLAFGITTALNVILELNRRSRMGEPKNNPLPPPFVHIAAADHTLYALDQSGRVWMRHGGNGVDESHEWRLDRNTMDDWSTKAFEYEKALNS